MLSKNKRKFSRVENKDSKSICSAMETELSVWVNEVRELNACIDGDSIRAKAHVIYQSIHPEITPENPPSSIKNEYDELNNNGRRFIRII